MKLGSIFYEEQYSEAYEYVSKHNDCMIQEIDADENGRMFKIVEMPQSTESELARYEIAELKVKLAATDYQAIKYAEGVLTAEEYADVKAQRQAWRDRINELENMQGR